MSDTQTERKYLPLYVREECHAAVEKKANEEGRKIYVQAEILINLGLKALEQQNPIPTPTQEA